MRREVSCRACGRRYVLDWRTILLGNWRYCDRCRPPGPLTPVRAVRDAVGN